MPSHIRDAGSGRHRIRGARHGQKRRIQEDDQSLFARWLPSPPERHGDSFPGFFIRGSVFRKTRFDPSFKIAGDYELAARVITHENLARLSVLVTHMEEGGISANPKDCSLLEERVRVCSRASPQSSGVFVGMRGKYYERGVFARTDIFGVRVHPAGTAAEALHTALPSE